MEIEVEHEQIEFEDDVEVEAEIEIEQKGRIRKLKYPNLKNQYCKKVKAKIKKMRLRL